MAEDEEEVVTRGLGHRPTLANAKKVRTDRYELEAIGKQGNCWLHFYRGKQVNTPAWTSYLRHAQRSIDIPQAAAVVELARAYRTLGCG